MRFKAAAAPFFLDLAFPEGVLLLDDLLTEVMVLERYNAAAFRPVLLTAALASRFLATFPTGAT